RRHLGPDAVLKRVERAPERGGVVRSGPAVVQHGTLQISTRARYPRCLLSSGKWPAIATAARGAKEKRTAPQRFPAGNCSFCRAVGDLVALVDPLLSSPAGAGCDAAIVKVKQRLAHSTQGVRGE